MSSRVNLSLLVDHINGLPNDYAHLDPNLKFRFLFNDGIAESFFAYEISPSELKESSAASLLRKVDLAFRDALCESASDFFGPLLALLELCSPSLPRDVLYAVLPFMIGRFAETQNEAIMKDVVKVIEERCGRIMERRTKEDETK